MHDHESELDLVLLCTKVDNGSTKMLGQSDRRECGHTPLKVQVSAYPNFERMIVEAAAGDDVLALIIRCTTPVRTVRQRFVTVKSGGDFCRNGFTA